MQKELQRNVVLYCNSFIHIALNIGYSLLLNIFIKRAVLQILKYLLAYLFQGRQICFKCRENRLLIDVGILMGNKVSHPEHLFPWDCANKNTGVGCQFLLQGIILTLESSMVSHIAGRLLTI